MAEQRFDPRAPRLTRLSGIELRNFKSVRADQVTLGPLTVIAGANSAGKSTLIQAVLALTQVSRRRIEGRRFPLNDDLVRLGSFVSLRHQGSDVAEPVLLGARFTSDARDLRRNIELRMRMGYPVVMGAMLVLALVMVGWFRAKGWLGGSSDNREDR